MTVATVAIGTGPGRGGRAVTSVVAMGGRRMVPAIPHPPIGRRKNIGAHTHGSQIGAEKGCGLPAAATGFGGSGMGGVIAAPRPREQGRLVRPMVFQWPRRGSNPHTPFGIRDFKSRASASFATRPGVPRWYPFAALRLQSRLLPVSSILF